MEPFQKAEADQAVEDQEDGYDEIQEPRHDQDQNAGNERHDWRDMGDGQGHLKQLRDSDVVEIRFEAGILRTDSAIADVCDNAEFPQPTKNAPKLP
jgi:hypothetical protein